MIIRRRLSIVVIYIYGIGLFLNNTLATGNNEESLRINTLNFDR